MQAIRSYLVGGVSVAGAAALVAAVPSVTPPDVQIAPAQARAVDLAAADTPLERLDSLYNDYWRVKLNGWIQSETVLTNVTVPLALDLIDPTLTAIKNNPDKTPTILNGVLDGLVLGLTGVSGFTDLGPSLGLPGAVHIYAPVGSPADQVPGFYVPLDIAPDQPGCVGPAAICAAVPVPKPYEAIYENSVLPGIVVANDDAAENLTDAGVPAVFAQARLSTQRVGVTVIQASGLIRGAAVGGVQGVVDAPFGDGGKFDAAVDGLGYVSTAAFGDSSLPDVKVDPTDQSADAPTAPSVRKLGAVKAVGQSVATATKDVIGSLRPGSDTQ